jgi:hypothetical protein
VCGGQDLPAAALLQHQEAAAWGVRTVQKRVILVASHSLFGCWDGAILACWQGC